VNDGEGRLGTIARVVRQAYRSPSVVSRYVTIGLWPAEEILIADFVPDEARVLDLGCGAGRTSIALAELGLEVVGIDISEPMIEVARDQALRAGVQERTEFHVMDARQLDLPEDSFDVALFSYNGIELVPGREGKRLVLEQVHRSLAPGGRLVLCAHSLFALNAYAPMRLRAFCRFLVGHLGVPVRERELGERFLDDDWEEAKYLQVLPPSTYRRMLRSCGYALLYFNTRRRIESGRRRRWWSAFEDGERFFVAQKATVAADPADT
jgi:SAM-dependent methyltransferase